ncbi:MAG: hypothetical protein AAB788_02260 [Patescibacteria group bacterium]
MKVLYYLFLNFCHPLEEGDPAYNHFIKNNNEYLVWIPASAGMTSTVVLKINVYP